MLCSSRCEWLLLLTISVTLKSQPQNWVCNFLLYSKVEHCTLGKFLQIISRNFRLSFGILSSLVTRWWLKHQTSKEKKIGQVKFCQLFSIVSSRCFFRNPTAYTSLVRVLPHVPPLSAREVGSLYTCLHMRGECYWADN